MTVNRCYKYDCKEIAKLYHPWSHQIFCCKEHVSNVIFDECHKIICDTVNCKNISHYSFGEGNYPTKCKIHRQVGMFNQQYFVKPIHNQNYINVRCSNDTCRFKSTYGWYDFDPLCCKQHKFFGMKQVNLTFQVENAVDTRYNAVFKRFIDKSSRELKVVPPPEPMYFDPLTGQIIEYVKVINKQVLFGTQIDDDIFYDALEVI